MTGDSHIDEQRKQELMDLVKEKALEIMKGSEEDPLGQYAVFDGPKRRHIPPPVYEDMGLEMLRTIAREHEIEMYPDTDAAAAIRAIETEAVRRIGPLFDEAHARGKEAIEGVKWPGLFGAGNVEVWYPPVAANYALKFRGGYLIADGLVGIRIPCHRHVNWMRAYAGAFARVLRDHGVEARAWVEVD